MLTDFDSFGPESQQGVAVLCWHHLERDASADIAATWERCLRTFLIKDFKHVLLVFKHWLAHLCVLRPSWGPIQICPGPILCATHFFYFVFFVTQECVISPFLCVRYTPVKGLPCIGDCGACQGMRDTESHSSGCWQPWHSHLLVCCLQVLGLRLCPPRRL